MKKYCVHVSPVHVPALLAGEGERLDRLRARDVDDIQRRAGDPRELDRPVRRLALELGRARERVVDGVGVAGGQRFGDEHFDRVAVLGMHHHERAGLRRDLHGAEERLVVDHQRVLVGHEELVGRDAVLLGQARELVERAALSQVGDGDVEAVVDQRLPFALLVPGGERVAEGLAVALDAEVDVGRRAAERGGRVARREVVDRRLAAPRHREMCVRVDASRQDVLPARVDHLVRRPVERLADQGDPLAFDEDVRDVVVRRGDDAASLDQHGHGWLPSVDLASLETLIACESRKRPFLWTRRIALSTLGQTTFGRSRPSSAAVKQPARLATWASRAGSLLATCRPP